MYVNVDQQLKKIALFQTSFSGFSQQGLIHVINYDSFNQSA